MRLIGTIAAIFCFTSLFSAAYSAFTFGQDPFSYADGVCPAPPNGVDSAERQACLNDYESLTPFDVAGKSLLFAGGAFIVAVAAFALSKEQVPETQPRPDR